MWLPHHKLLLQALRDPASLTDSAPAKWDLLLRLARRSQLLAHLAARMPRLAGIPEEAAIQLRAAQIEAAERRRMALWEINRIERVLRGTGVPAILLKGAAYILAELPVAAGRLLSDVDILVPEGNLNFIEDRFQQFGWESVKLDSYDQHYYRTWMHELPPLQYPGRVMQVDVHHAILPRTSRLHPDSRLLWQCARPLYGFYRLGDEDMVLHSATHLFYDSDFENRLRDLVDVDQLLRHFGARPDFWTILLERARQLDLQRPFFYALRFAQRLLETPIPEEVQRCAREAAPNRSILLLMDRLVPIALMPPHPDASQFRYRAACFPLYLRSHWLRMPPLLLTRHLLHKALLSQRETSTA
ncbi:MAG TPA: nucleotidyltransferase family protein [Burkholderiales bacterium]|nr:nucleotidyltransferase family protein [Burkholderiales bacterium]